MESARSTATSTSSAKFSEFPSSPVGRRSLLSAELGKPAETLEGSSLWRCVQAEDWEGLKVALRKPGAKVSLRDESFGWTAGHFAANSGIAPVIKALLDLKAKVDPVDNEGNTMLMLATRRGHLQAAEFLVGKQADLNSQNHNGWTALMWAALNGHEGVASMLLNANAEHLRADIEGRTACMWAARHGHLGIVETFLACGLNLSVQDQAGLTVLDHCQEHLDMAATIAAVDEVNTCLHEAARCNDIEGVREAIEAGADVDLRDGDGWTALMWAALHNSLDMVQLVVRYGAKPSLLDESGRVMEHLQTQHLAVGEAVESILGANDRLLDAAKGNDWRQAAEELATGAFVNVRDDRQRTSLMWAAKHCCAEGVHMLLSKNAHVDDRDGYGWAAVHYAVAEKSPETVSMFHHLGADFAVKTYEGDGLLHMAVRADDPVMVQLLLAAELDKEEVDVDMFTPLMRAGYLGLQNAMQALLAYGADIEAKSPEEHVLRTTIALAVVQGEEAAVATMLGPLQAPPGLPFEVEQEEEKLAKPRAKAKAAGPAAGPQDKVVAAVKKAGAVAALVPALVVGKPGPSSEARAAAGGVAARRRAAPKAKVDCRGHAPTALIEEAIRKRTEQPWKALAPPARAAVRQVDGDGCTPLALAVRYKRTAIGTQLLAAKADPNAADARGTTVLMEAVTTRQVEVVEMMLDLGAKIDKRNKAGKTALDVCEDEVIRQMLNRRITLGLIPPTDPKLVEESHEQEERDAAKASTMRIGFRVRLEGLPVNLTPALLEQHIRMVMKRCGAANPQHVKVELDPITGQPRGHAYADFLDAAAQDLAMRGNGDEIRGRPVRIYKEPKPRA